MTRLAALIALLGAALASGFGVAPARLELEGAPGARVSGSVVIFSSAAGAVLRPELADWWLDPEGRLRLLPAGSSPRSLVPWLRFPEEPITLSGERRVYYSVSVPRGARGSYHAAVLLRPEPEPFAEAAGWRVNLAATLFLPVYLTVTGTGSPGLALSGVKVESGEIEAWVENEGNQYLRFTARAEVLGSGGALLATLPLGGDVILPGGARRLSRKLPRVTGAAVIRVVVEAPGAQAQVWEVGL